MMFNCPRLWEEKSVFTSTKQLNNKTVFLLRLWLWTDSTKCLQSTATARFNRKRSSKDLVFEPGSTWWWSGACSNSAVAATVNMFMSIIIYFILTYLFVCSQILSLSTGGVDKRQIPIPKPKKRHTNIIKTW